MNQLYLFAEKGDGYRRTRLDSGTYRRHVRLDARFTTAQHLETRVLPRSEVDTRSGSTVRLCRSSTVEGAHNDLKVKVGHYYAPNGYEACARQPQLLPELLPYTFQYGEPLTFTGVQATWQYTETVAIGGGIQQGWDNLDAGGNLNTGFNLTYVENFQDGASLA